MADKHLDLHGPAVLLVRLPAVEHRERVRRKRETRRLLAEPLSGRHGRVFFLFPRGQSCLIRGHLSDGVVFRRPPEIGRELVVQPVEVRAFRVRVLCRLVDQSLHGRKFLLRGRQSLQAVPVRQYHGPDIPAGRPVERERLRKHAALPVADMIQFCLAYDSGLLFHGYLLSSGGFLRQTQYARNGASGTRNSQKKKNPRGQKFFCLRGNCPCVSIPKSGNDPAEAGSDAPLTPPDAVAQMGLVNRRV